MIHIKYKHPPKCKTCGKPMKSWNPFADHHEHYECISRRVQLGIRKTLKDAMKKDVDFKRKLGL